MTVFRGLLGKNYKSWGLSALSISMLLSLPLLVVIGYLFQPASDVWHHLASTVLPQYVSNTLLLLGATAIFATIFGVGLAWIVSQYEFRSRKMVEWLLVVPLAIPTYLMAFTQANIFSYTGIIRQFSSFLFGGDGIYLDLMHIPGLAFILALALFPYIYLPLRVVFRGSLANYVEAARSMGIGEWKIFRKILLPLSRPALAGGLFLVCMEVLNDYGAVKYFGINTLTTGIFSAWFSMGDLNSAIRIAALLLLCVFVLMSLERYHRKRKGFEEKSNSFPLERKKLSASRSFLLGLICWMVLAISLALPLLQLILDATKTWRFTLNDGFLSMCGRSIGLALATSILVVAMGIIIQYTKRLQSGRLLAIVSGIANSGYAIPGAVIAVGVLLFTGSLDSVFGSLVLTGSVAAMIYAYSVRFLAVGKGSIEASFNQSVQNADWASLSLGASPWKTLRKISLPLVARGTIAAAILVFVDVLKELPLTLILRPFNFYTFATRTFEYASDEMLAKAALPALCIIAVGTIPIAFLNRFINGNEHSTQA